MMRNLGVQRPQLLLSVIWSLVLILEQSCAFGSRGERGEVVERWETSAHGLTIRVTEFKEKNPVYLTHFFYVFESSSTGSGNWHEIMEVKNDDDVPLPRNQIRLISDKVAYAFMNEKYAVTTDSGQTWTVLEAIPAKLSNLQSKGNIKVVQINPDGTGKMQIDALLDGQITGLTFSTKDYGRGWNIE